MLGEKSVAYYKRSDNGKRREEKRAEEARKKNEREAPLYPVYSPFFPRCSPRRSRLFFVPIGTI